jgi:hypothetical protein
MKNLLTTNDNVRCTPLLRDTFYPDNFLLLVFLVG